MTLPRFLVAAAAAVVALALLAALGVFVYGSQPITFNVSAQTERVRFVAGEASPSRWVLDDVEMVRGYGAPVAFSGYFQPADSVEVLIERVANGPLYVHVSSTRRTGVAASDVGTFFAKDEEVLGTAGSTVELFVTGLASRADSGSTLVIPVTGQVETGREVGLATWGSTALLRSGRVRMLGRSIFGRRVFEAGGVELDPGDQFRVEDQLSPSLGFVVADERPGLTVAYRSIGRRGLVVRPGGGAYPVTASFFDRVLRDPFFLGISLLSGIFVVSATILTFLRDWRASRRRAGAVPEAPRAPAPAPPAPVPEPGRDGPPESAGPAAGAGFLLVLLLPLAAEAQVSVRVLAGVEGQGVLRARQNTCYVVVPEHVVAASVGDIEVIGWNGVRAKAVREATFEADLAVLRVRDGGDLLCTPWLPTYRMDALLAAGGGYLRLVEHSGVETRIPIDIRRVGPDHLTARSRDPRREIAMTMSGAPLVVNGLVVGLLQDVCGGAAEDSCDAGDAEVLRIDAVARLTDGFFAVPVAPLGDNPIADYNRMQASARAREDSIRAEEQARMDSLQAATEALSDSLRLAIMAHHDSISMASRGGRPPDLPTLKRDLYRVELFSSGGIFECVFQCFVSPIEVLPGQREGRLLYAVILLSEPVLSVAPELPDEVGRCALHSTSRRLRTFPVPRREEVRGGWALAWGGTGARLAPGEYWLECVVDGVSFESAHVTLLRPARPYGEFELKTDGDDGGDAVAVVRTVQLEATGGERASWSVGPEAVRPRVVLAVPRRPDARITIRFDAKQVVGPPDASMPHSFCSVSGFYWRAETHVEAVRPGLWRVSHDIATTPGVRWRPGEYSGACGALDGVHYFEFLLVLR